MSSHTNSLSAEASSGIIIAAMNRPQWYAVQTRSRFEKIVQAELSAKGIENYLPLSRELHQWKDRKKTVEMPLFPAYVFARIAGVPIERLRVLQTNGVAAILGDGVNLTPIPDAEIDAVKLMVQSRIYSPCAYVREGMRVRVDRGPLSGTEGFVLRTKNSTRLVVSIQLLARSIAAEVDLSDLKILS